MPAGLVRHLHLREVHELPRASSLRSQAWASRSEDSRYATPCSSWSSTVRTRFAPSRVASSETGVAIRGHRQMCQANLKLHRDLQ